MHTDEYEISLAREINHCERVVQKIREALAARQRQYGMEYPDASAVAAVELVAVGRRELAAWKEDFEALPEWERRLEEYREALSMMRISASRF